MSETAIVCPKCGTEIKLDEQLAAPLLEATRKKYELQIAAKDSEVAIQEAALLSREQALAASERSLEKRVTERMEQERVAIAREESLKAEQKLSGELSARSRELTDLKSILEERDLKLAEAQKAQAEIVKKERELADAKRELDLTIEKRVTGELEPLRALAKTEAAEEFKLKVLEREQTISSMQRQIEELKKRAEQGSQQLQGEVQELELETLLKLRFPFDHIEAVAKGEHGGDIVHCVNTPVGLKCGAILWEAKRTKNWSDAWLVKLREDQRNAKAELAILISHALPKGVEAFDLVDGVWVAHPRMIVPLALTLRQTLLEVAAARQSAEGQQTKATMVYQYLTGPRFRQRVQAIVEAFGSMQEDLDKEKRAIQKQWAKREEQIGRVMQSTVGMFGDLQGIAGKSLQEIEGLDMDGLALGSGSTGKSEQEG
jgi:hypothetical protein